MRITVIKKKLIIIFLLLIGIMDSLIIIGISPGLNTYRDDTPYSFSTLAVLAIFTLIALWYICFRLMINKLEINKKGVTYKTHKDIYSINWEEVDSIIIYPNPYKGSIDKTSMVCFIKGEHPLRYYNIRQLNENFFGAQFREKMIWEIRKYWDRPIQGIYQATGKNI